MKFPPPNTDDFLRHAWKSFESRNKTDLSAIGKFKGWPKVLQAEVKKYGAVEVWTAGLAALDYPPTWAEGSKAITAILEELERRHGT